MPLASSKLSGAACEAPGTGMSGPHRSSTTRLNAIPPPEADFTPLTGKSTSHGVIR